MSFLNPTLVFGLSLQWKFDYGTPKVFIAILCRSPKRQKEFFFSSWFSAISWQLSLERVETRPFEESRIVYWETKIIFKNWDNVGPHYIVVGVSVGSQTSKTGEFFVMPFALSMPIFIKNNIQHMQ